MTGLEKVEMAVFICFMLVAFVLFIKNHIEMKKVIKMGKENEKLAREICEEAKKAHRALRGEVDYD